MKDIIGLIRKKYVQSPALENLSIQGPKTRKIMIPKRPIEQSPQRYKPIPTIFKKQPITKPIKTLRHETENLNKSIKLRSIDRNIRKLEKDEVELQKDVQDRKDTVEQNIQKNLKSQTKKFPEKDSTIDRDERSLIRLRNKKEKLKDKKIDIVQSSIASHIRKIAQIIK